MKVWVNPARNRLATLRQLTSMFNFLKKTWRQEEPQSHLPAPSTEETELHLDQPQSQPTVDPSQLGSKRSREEIEPGSQPSSAERPSKAAKTGIHDSIRNHLPEIVDSRHRDDAVAPLSLSVLKEQIIEGSKLQNSRLQVLRR